MILILAVLAALQSPGDTVLASFVARARAGTDALRHPDAARLAVGAEVQAPAERACRT